MMRAYMYSYGYGNAVMARDLLTQNGLRTDPCTGCTECTADCVKGFDLRTKISEVIRIVDVPEQYLSGGLYA